MSDMKVFECGCSSIRYYRSKNGCEFRFGGTIITGNEDLALICDVVSDTDPRAGLFEICNISNMDKEETYHLLWSIFHDLSRAGLDVSRCKPWNVWFDWIEEFFEGKGVKE
ncbi:hypothetical protein [Shouchella lonarensis]|uniref:Uncharacterized protein n=1 Tax=Shouchella lonarensis TaxID=1464122 RepID=A0A1G6N193_9BACI|nr:hypothetical protein [Shouchella lonarensis]SDC61602.1 hypothetical protein SAMN05421737_11171 [Shouchella lonarensis]